MTSLLGGFFGIAGGLISVRFGGASPLEAAMIGGAAGATGAIIGMAIDNIIWPAIKTLGKVAKKANRKVNEWADD